MTFVARCISALLLGSVVLGARADAPAPLRVQFDPNTPHMQVMRKLAWAEAEFGVAGVRWVAQVLDVRRPTNSNARRPGR